MRGCQYIYKKNCTKNGKAKIAFEYKFLDFFFINEALRNLFLHD